MPSQQSSKRRVVLVPSRPRAVKHEKTGVDMHSGQCLPVFSIKVQQTGKKGKYTEQRRTHVSPVYDETPRAGSSLVGRVASSAAKYALFWCVVGSAIKNMVVLKIRVFV